MSVHCSRITLRVNVIEMWILSMYLYCYYCFIVIFVFILLHRSKGLPERDMESLGVMGWEAGGGGKFFRRRRCRRHRPPQKSHRYINLNCCELKYLCAIFRGIHAPRACLQKSDQVL